MLTRLAAMVRFAVDFEKRVYAGAGRLLARRPHLPQGSEPVRYVGAVAALLWSFTAVSSVELVVIHLIVPWETVRLALDVLGIWGVVWCLGYTGCHYVYPHLLDDGGVRVRAAAKAPVVTLPWESVAGLSVRERSHEGSRTLRVDDGALVVAVAGRTNLDVRLEHPIEVTVRGSTVPVETVRIFADDPRAAVRMMGARQPR